MAKRAIANGDVVEDGASVSVRPPPWGVVFIRFASEDGATGGQFESALREVLSAKLSRQLRRAKELRYPVLLLLDQVPDPASAAWTMRSYDKELLARIVGKLLEPAPEIVDQVWLRNAEGIIELLLARMRRHRQ